MSLWGGLRSWLSHVDHFDATRHVRALSGIITSPKVVNEGVSEELHAEKGFGVGYIFMSDK